MNLWAKRIGQLAVFPVALFFFSCEDEAGVLGYKNPNPKFEASYVEIPVESSVLLLDSQRTSNFIFNGETNRLLLGRYSDDKFGTVNADAYTQYFTTSSAKLSSSASYDSVSLDLVLDFYHYGKQAASNLSISVYELNEDLKYADRANYFNRSEVQVKPGLLGSKTFSVDPEAIDEFVEDKTDTAIVIKVKLDRTFGEAIFNQAIKWRDYANPVDSIFIKYESFVELFKGLAIKSDNADVIVGINPSSGIRLHYHYTGSDSKVAAASLMLGMSFTSNFSQIKNDRSATELSGLTQFSQDFYPTSGQRYVQAGTGVFTKLDFGKFFEFCDTVPNVVITSAELSISGVETSDLTPPSNFILRLLDNNNYLERYTSKNIQDSIDYRLYNPRTYSEAFRAHPGTLSIDGGQPITEGGNVFYVLGDANPYVQYSEKKQSMSGNFALFFQQLSLVADQKRRFQHFLLTPVTAVPQSKSVNRIVFNKDNIKLKVYYTKPTTPVNQ